LSFHRVCEAAASDMLKCFFIDGEFNPADILSKHWGYQQIWRTLQPLLFWQGCKSVFGEAVREIMLRIIVGSTWFGRKFVSESIELVL
jgi:hypothetical protein